MNERQFEYKTFMWVLGNTALRHTELALKQEHIVGILMRAQQRAKEDGDDWRWDERAKRSLHRELIELGDIDGESKNPAKDARERTSGLVELGFLTAGREVTDAGRALSNPGTFEVAENPLRLSTVGNMYFLQLMKASTKIQGVGWVRGFLVLAWLLDRWRQLSEDEFQLIPLAIDSASLDTVDSAIGRMRSDGGGDYRDAVWRVMMQRDHYRELLEEFMTRNLSESDFVELGINRKSRKNESLYHQLFWSLHSVVVDGRRDVDAVVAVWDATRRLKTVGTRWRKLLFGSAQRVKVAREGVACFAGDVDWLSLGSEREFRSAFFKWWHLNKALATLKDYSDLILRYVSLSECVEFVDRTVRLTLPAAAYFRVVHASVSSSMFERCPVLCDWPSLSALGGRWVVGQDDLRSAAQEILGFSVLDTDSLGRIFEVDRQRRFEKLIESRFDRRALGRALEAFDKREDTYIRDHVSSNATIATSFEYVVGLCWYHISARVGDVLSFMRLSLDGSLLPVTHAAGGDSDIVYRYEASAASAAHDLLLEVTLLEGVNVRRGEMEPVSRHLGSHILQGGGSLDYCVFVAPNIDVNVANDFRLRRTGGFWSQDGSKGVDLKIVPLTIQQLRSIVVSGVLYSELCLVFDRAYRSAEVRPRVWLDALDADIRELCSAVDGRGVL